MRDKAAYVLIIAASLSAHAIAADNKATKVEPLEPEFLDFLAMTDTNTDIWPILSNEKSVAKAEKETSMKSNKAKKKSGAQQRIKEKAHE